MANRVRIPGVFIEEVVNPSLAVVADNVKTVAVVGTATDYIISYETVTRTQGVFTDTLTSVTISDLISVEGVYLGDLLISSDKYSVSGLNIVWSDTNFIDNIGQYTVKLKVTKAAAYYNPIVYYTNTQTINDIYGYPVINGAINQIPAAVQKVFEGGAQRVIVVQSASGGTTDIKAAIDKLRQEDVQLIVCPGITDTVLQTYLADHVNFMSSVEGSAERRGFIAPTTLTADIATISAQSESFANERILNIAPGNVNMTFSNGLTDYSMNVSAIYSAAYLAGRLANPNVRTGKPITRETAGVDSLNTKYLKTEREILAGSGTIVLYTDKAGVVRVNQGLTTDMSNYNNSEISVSMIKDEVRGITRSSLDAQFIGSELDTVTGPASVVAAVTQILTGLKGRLIVDFANVVATLNETDPSAVDVSFDISPIRPFNYINIKFTVTR